LAGGASTRMGQDKALLRFRYQPLIEHALKPINACFHRYTISVHQHKPSLTGRQVCDAMQGHGPMVGITSAMQRVDTRWVFVMACDMPFASTALIQAMAQQRRQQQVIVPRVNNIMQPLFAFYEKSCLPTLQAHLDAKQYSIKKMIATLNTTMINESLCRQYDPKLLSFFDLDTPDDVAQGLLLATT